MNNNIKNILKFVLFLSLGIGIFIWVYSDTDTEAIFGKMKNANYFWIVISLVLGFFSHVSRAMRWNLLIRPLGYKPRLINTFFAVLVMYVSNMVIPRSGEITRCGIVNRYEKVPVAKLLGTVVVERVFDFIMLFIFLAAALITQLSEIKEIVENNSGVKEKITNMFSIPVILVLALTFVISIVLIYIYRQRIKKLGFYQKIIEFINNFIEGVKTVFKMEHKVEFIIHSFLIWILYFLMIYVVFFSFGFTSHLTIYAGLTVFVMSGFGMVFPSPGGIGSWHFMAIQALLIYNVSHIDAETFAIVAHGSMTLFLIVIGVIALILLPVINRNNEKL